MEHVGGNQATPNVDYNATTNSSIMIPSGHDSANITISIPDDLNPELEEVFDVSLEHVELVGQSSPSLPPQLGGNQRAAVTIVTSDDAHGLIVIKAVDPDPGSHGSRKTVNETENLLVQFAIERLKGNDEFLQKMTELASTFKLIIMEKIPNFIFIFKPTDKQTSPRKLALLCNNSNVHTLYESVS